MAGSITEGHPQHSLPWRTQARMRPRVLALKGRSSESRFTKAAKLS